MGDYADIVSQVRIAAIGVKKPSNRLTLMQDAADAIEELLAAVPKWISVEDALPDVVSEVLCYCPFYDCSYTASFDGERWWHFGGLGTDPIRFKVTHWMPLPDAPKEVE